MPRYVLPIFAVLATLMVLPLFLDREQSLNAQENAAKPADHVSYTLGLDIGGSLQQSGLTVEDIKSADFIAGIVDALNKSKSKLSEEEHKAAFASLGARVKERMEKRSKENLDKANAFLEANKSKEGVIALPSGLQYVEMKKGTGAQPKESSTVTVHYHGTLTDGTVFDSSLKGEPLAIAVNGVIPGWTEALQRMRVGDKWKLFIPPNLGYGAQGAPGGVIGPNQALVFEVELLKVQ